MRSGALILALVLASGPVGLRAQEDAAVVPLELPRIEVIPPDFVFQFRPRVEVPGRPTLAMVKNMNTRA